jgi:hypothetical protein
MRLAGTRRHKLSGSVPPVPPEGPMTGGFITPFSLTTYVGNRVDASRSGEVATSHAVPGQG